MLGQRRVFLYVCHLCSSQLGSGVMIEICIETQALLDSRLLPSATSGRHAIRLSSSSTRDTANHNRVRLKSQFPVIQHQGHSRKWTSYLDPRLVEVSAWALRCTWQEVGKIFLDISTSSLRHHESTPANPAWERRHMRCGALVGIDMLKCLFETLEWSALINPTYENVFANHEARFNEGSPRLLMRNFRTGSEVSPWANPNIIQ